MLLTRPDVAFTLQWLSTALARPYIEHLKVAKNLLRYLLGTKFLAIIYRGDPKGIASKSLISYYNSDFARDKKTSKLTYAYLFKLANKPIS
jgi:hypothetical protein